MISSIHLPLWLKYYFNICCKTNQWSSFIGTCKNVISELTVYMVVVRTDRWRVRNQQRMLRDWNRWMEALTVTRWICQRPMMMSTCNGINNSVSSLSCSSINSSSIQLLNDMEQLVHARTSILIQMNLWNIKIIALNVQTKTILKYQLMNRKMWTSIA